MNLIRLLPCLFAGAVVACSPGRNGDAGSPAATSAPSTAPLRQPAATTARWRCGALNVTTRFDDSALQSMTLSHSGRDLQLKAVDTRDGARFADAAGNEFRSRPGRISLTLAGRPTVACRKTRTSSRSPVATRPARLA